MQDAGKRVGCVSVQDAGKQRPYYGREFSAWECFSRKSTRILLAGRDAERCRVSMCIHPPTQAGSRRFYVKNAQTPPITVHSRDASCVRPVYHAAQWAGVRPAILSASRDRSFSAGGVFLLSS